MGDITKIKVADESESNFKLYPRNEEFAKRAGGSGVQPDWNQNDDTKPDYVKNRPFYTGDPVETVLLEEQVVTFTDGWSNTSFNFDISVEDIVKVTWDGAEYTCIPTLDADGLSFGNEFLLNNEREDTGEPFWYEAEYENFYTQSTDSHRIKVSKISKKSYSD